jgi:uncharacterized protein
MGQKTRSARRLRRLDRAIIAGVEVPVAERFTSRLLGLAFLSRERAGPGLVLPRCRGVHTFGMRFRLDLLFLGPGGAPLEVRRSVPPGRVARCRRAAAVLELPAGAGHGKAPIRAEGPSAAVEGDDAEGRRLGRNRPR